MLGLLNKYCIFSIFIFIISCSVLAGKSKNTVQENEIPPTQFMLSNSCLGTEFWIALPQNDIDNTQYGEIGVEIVVTSFTDTRVTVEMPEFGFMISKSVTAFEQTVFSSSKGEAAFAWELKESDKVTQMGIHVTSDDPVSVYLVNQRWWSSDGYLAIPVSSWGNDYIHNCYYDFYWNHAQYGGGRGGGFIVIAAENETRVNIKLDGTGEHSAGAAGGHKIGDIYSVRLDKGETYMIRGDATTCGMFDLSGSRITANKKIGVISFHQLSFVPSHIPNGGSHLSEMIPPVSSWGKKFVTVQFPRKPVGSSDGKGDFFRLICSEDNTHIHVRYYDPGDGSIKGQSERTLNKAGNYFEFLHDDILQPNTKKSIYGVSVWTADKPVMLMQYSYSSLFDNITEWAPFMILIPPIEQYIESGIFQTPSLSSDFKVNQVTIFALGDVSDPEYKLLKSIKINGDELYKKNGKLLSNNIPGTDIYWARLNIEKGVYRIESSTKVSGYLYGTCSWNTYGWPALYAVNKIDESDTAAPKIEINEDCGNYTIVATEITNGKTGDEPKQIDQGLSKILLVVEESYNYTLKLEKPEDFIPENKITKQVFYLNQKNKTEPGFAKFALLDRAGNILIDSVSFSPDSILFQTESIKFGNTRVNNTNEISFNISNPCSKPIMIDTLYCMSNNVFCLKENGAGFEILQEESKDIGIIYTPDTEKPDDFDSDTLVIKTECDEYKLNMSGRGVMPHIAVSDADFGNIKVDSSVCLEEINGEGLKIENTGSDTLAVNNIEGIELPFSIENPTPDFPFKITPSEFVIFKSICFVPTDSGQFDKEITINCDASDEDDKTVLLIAKAFIEDDTTDVLDTDIENNYLRITPNPASDFITINCNEQASPFPTAIEIYNVFGEKVFSKTAGEQADLLTTTIDISGLPQGIYYITYMTKKVMLFEKFIVLK